MPHISSNVDLGEEWEKVKIPTDKGQQTIPEVLNSLMYASYAANRGYGLTHEQLIREGIGNDQMKLKYEEHE